MYDLAEGLTPVVGSAGGVPIIDPLRALLAEGEPGKSPATHPGSVRVTLQRAQLILNMLGYTSMVPNASAMGFCAGTDMV